MLEYISLAPESFLACWGLSIVPDQQKATNGVSPPSRCRRFGWTSVVTRISDRIALERGLLSSPEIS